MRQRLWTRATMTLAAGLCLMAASCANNQSETSEQSSATDNTPTASAVSDAQIAAIVVAANNADIEAGRLAQSKAQRPEVKAFGQQMVSDHSGVNERATALVGQLGITPEDSPVSLQLKTAADSTRATLETLSGAEFDRAYVDNEVTFHQQVLDAIDQTLVPNAQNPQLKQLLVEVRPAIAAHLEHARQLQTSLGGTATQVR